MGSNFGTVRVYLWPFCDFKSPIVEYYDVCIHQGPVSTLKISGC